MCTAGHSPPSEAFSAAKDNVSPCRHCDVWVCRRRLRRLCGTWCKGCSLSRADTCLALCDHRGRCSGLSTRLRTSLPSAQCFLFIVTKTGRVMVLISQGLAGALQALLTEDSTLV